MNSTSMRQKQVGVDRFSSLPDLVLCHILSFLPTKYAVGTSVLATRWRYLFASVTCLDFDDSIQLGPQEANEDPARAMTGFMNSVERVFLLRNLASIDTLRLKCGSNVDASRVDAWLCAALWRSIRELDLCFSMEGFTMLPCNVFTCKTLVVLKIAATFVLNNVPIKACLPKLKIIHLERVQFLDDNSIQRLVSSCPVLEDLVLRLCGWENVPSFNISAPSLRSFTMNCWPMWYRSYDSKIFNYVIKVNAPNLEYLNYIDFVPEGFSVKNLQSLVKAHIEVEFSSQQREYINPKYAETMTELLIGISKVRFLRISDAFLEAMGSYNLALPIFRNVTKLVLVFSFVGLRNMPYLLSLLHSSPVLETLAFEEILLHEEYADVRRNFNPTQPVPSCLLFHLKTIEIESFMGYKDELTTVEYFLKNAGVLEKLTIHTQGMTEEEESKVFKKLLMFPRSSKACQVAIL